jgi:hypothetical protein
VVERHEAVRADMEHHCEHSAMVLVGSTDIFLDDGMVSFLGHYE